MRISDWSSDVCSSDLVTQPLFRSADERRGAFFVLGFQHAPVARARTHALLHGHGKREMSDIGGNAASDYACPTAEEILRRAMLEQEIFAGGYKAVDPALQRRLQLWTTGKGTCREK